MPNRILREGILTSEAVSSLGWAEEVFYRRLMSVVDDYGRFHAGTKLIRSACYPLLIDKVSDADIDKWISRCIEAGLVSVYPAKDGKRYLEIEKFGQQVRTKSKFPEPTDEYAKQMKSSDINCYQMKSNAHLVGGVVGGVVVSDTDVSLVVSEPDSELMDCPHKEIISLYAKHLPTLKQPRVWDGERAESLRARWRYCAKANGVSRGYTTREEGISFWGRYFEFVAKETSLPEGFPRDNGSVWYPDLPWLVKKENFVKVVEGNYAKR